MDWLAGGDRNEIAVERIYTAAADVIAARGLDRLSIDDIAERAGCSRATIYRHAGGKEAIRDAVLARSIARIATTVETAVASHHGSERVVQAILMSLDAIRGDAVSAALLRSTPADNLNTSLADSPRLAVAAVELAGLDREDQLSPGWIVHVVLSLLFLPIGDRKTEEAVVRRFVAPAFS